MNKRFISVLPKAGLVLIISLTAACGGDQEENNNTVTPQDTTEKIDSAGKNEVDARVPSPADMITFLKQVGNTGKNTGFLNSTANQSKYSSDKQKALNFGVYAADLLYCSSFSYGPEAVKYFASLKKMGEELGIANVISEEDMKKIDQNVGDAAQLDAISNDLYYAAFNQLEKENRGNILALLVAGGYIESLWITTNLEPKFKKDSPVMTRIAGQKYTIENILDFMKKYESDAAVADMISNLNDLKLSFDKIEVKEGESQGLSTRNGKKVLGGSKTVITEDQYKEISSRIASIRKSITEN